MGMVQECLSGKAPELASRRFASPGVELNPDDGWGNAFGVPVCDQFHSLMQGLRADLDQLLESAEHYRSKLGGVSRFKREMAISHYRMVVSASLRTLATKYCDALDSCFRSQCEVGLSEYTGAPGLGRVKTASSYMRSAWDFDVLLDACVLDLAKILI